MNTLLTSTNPFSLFQTSLPLLEEILLKDQKISKYPPYNIIAHTSNEATIELAVSGFTESELEINLHNSIINVSGSKNLKEENNEKYVYKGISARDFSTSFRIDKNAKITEASLINGILTIRIVREVPEEEKPQKIEIGKKSTLQFLAE